MKAVLQRVTEASVSVDQKEISRIKEGWLILLGIAQEDTGEEIPSLAQKILKLRAFNDKEGKMNLSVRDVEGSLLIVSQFTLHANCKKGNRPSFVKAAPPEKARKLYEDFISYMKEEGVPLGTGSFGAKMAISIEADGPVTLLLDSSDL